MGSDPPVLNSTSPEFMYQSNTSPTPSLGSATKPSSDTDMSATSFDIANFLSMSVIARAYGSDVSKPRVIRKPQFASQAIVARGEAPDTMRNSASDLATLGHPLTAEDTHLLFLAAD